MNFHMSIFFFKFNGRFLYVVKLFSYFFKFVTVSAVQHERAPRPSVAVQHQLALQKLGYNFTRQQPFIPTPTSLAFPSLHSYNGLVPALPESNTHNSFMERSSFQNFPSPRLSETISTDVSQLNPLLGTHIGSLSPLNPFKIPLFSASLNYPIPHPGYIPTNIIYPPLILTDPAQSIESKYFFL